MTSQQTAGFNCNRWNIEQRLNGQWLFLADCLTPGSAEATMAFEQRRHPTLELRITESTKFVPHRGNYR